MEDYYHKKVGTKCRLCLDCCCLPGLGQTPALADAGDNPPSIFIQPGSPVRAARPGTAVADQRGMGVFGFGKESRRARRRARFERRRRERAEALAAAESDRAVRLQVPSLGGVPSHDGSRKGSSSAPGHANLKDSDQPRYQYNISSDSETSRMRPSRRPLEGLGALSGVVEDDSFESDLADTSSDSESEDERVTGGAGDGDILSGMPRGPGYAAGHGHLGSRRFGVGVSASTMSVRSAVGGAGQASTTTTTSSRTLQLRSAGTARGPAPPLVPDASAARSVAARAAPLGASVGTSRLHRLAARAVRDSEAAAGTARRSGSILQPGISEPPPAVRLDPAKLQSVWRSGVSFPKFYQWYMRSPVAAQLRRRRHLEGNIRDATE